MPSEITRFVIFGFIGLFNSVLDIFIWRLLVRFFDKRKQLAKLIHSIKLNNYSFAHTISFVITVISSYILNHAFTFADSLKTDSLQIFKFFGVAVTSWVITTLVLNYLTSNKKIAILVNKLSVFEQSITNRNTSLILNQWPTIAKVLTIAVSMVTNYIGYKIFVF